MDTKFTTAEMAEITKKMEELKELISDMDVPLLRRTINFNNLRWLQRNLRINNGEHPNFKRASKLIRTFLRNTWIFRGGPEN